MVHTAFDEVPAATTVEGNRGEPEQEAPWYTPLIASAVEISTYACPFPVHVPSATLENSKPGLPVQPSPPKPDTLNTPAEVGSTFTEPPIEESGVQSPIATSALMSDCGPPCERKVPHAASAYTPSRVIWGLGSLPPPPPPPLLTAQGSLEGLLQSAVLQTKKSRGFVKPTPTTRTM